MNIFDGLGIISSKNMPFHNNRPPCIHNHHHDHHHQPRHVVETWRDGVSKVRSTRMGAEGEVWVDGSPSHTFRAVLSYMYHDISNFDLFNIKLYHNISLN